MRGGFAVAEALGAAKIVTKRLPGGGFKMTPATGQKVRGIRGPMVVRPGQSVSLSLIARACAISSQYFRRHAEAMGATRVSAMLVLTCEQAEQVLVKYGALRPAKSRAE